jgi:hypothetical protein
MKYSQLIWFRSIILHVYEKVFITYTLSVYSKCRLRFDNEIYVMFLSTEKTYGEQQPLCPLDILVVNLACVAETQFRDSSEDDNSKKKHLLQ